MLLPLIVIACASAPAVVVNSNDQSRAVLQRVVSEALSVEHVTLSPGALTNDNLLIIERSRHRAPSGVLINGRETELPDQFRLFLQGSDCVLQHVQTEREWVLAETRCIALERLQR
jgi:hypothetical protein